MNLDRVKVGFLPLVDAALPILARELGHAEAEGIDLELVKDMSWATVCDRLLYRQTDAAHLVAPLAISAALGLGRPAVPLAVPFVLGLNGNAITLRLDLAAQLTDTDTLQDVAITGQRLARLIRKGGKKLRFGVVHRYSSHNYMLRYWLMGCGIDPNADVEIVTVSPPYAAEALAEGEVDGICVGEPWNSVAVDRGVGVIVAVTAQIWRRGVEKVLTMRRDRMDEMGELAHRLLRALYRAGEDFIDPSRRDEIAALLAGVDYLGGSAELIARAMSNNILLAQGHEPVHVSDFMVQHREASNFPWVSQAAWLYAQMCRAGHVVSSESDYATAKQVFRPDVYRAALRNTGAALPGASAKLEGVITDPLGVGTVQGRLILGADSFFDRRAFDPDDLAAALTELPKN